MASIKSIPSVSCLLKAFRRERMAISIPHFWPMQGCWLPLSCLRILFPIILRRTSSTPMGLTPCFLTNRNQQPAFQASRNSEGRSIVAISFAISAKHLLRLFLFFRSLTFRFVRKVSENVTIHLRLNLTVRDYREFQWRRFELFGCKVGQRLSSE